MRTNTFVCQSARGAWVLVQQLSMKRSLLSAQRSGFTGRKNSRAGLSAIRARFVAEGLELNRIWSDFWTR